KDHAGKFLWPVYGESSRGLAWIFRRCDGNLGAEETPSGLLLDIGQGGIDTDGLYIDPEAMLRLLAVDPEDWKHQLPQMHEHYAKFGDRLPEELKGQLDALEQSLG